MINRVSGGPVGWCKCGPVPPDIHAKEILKRKRKKFTNMLIQGVRKNERKHYFNSRL